MYELEGKVALVTGAASKRGIGHDVAIHLAREGSNLVVMDKYEAPPSLFSGDEGWRGLNEVVEEIQSLGREALAIKADISIGKEVNEAVEKALAKFGKIDILVNCAGISAKRYSPVTELSEEDWRLLLDVNLTGSFLISKPVAKDMIRREEGGKIVHISSNRGKEARAFNAPYSASKFGVIGLVQSLALELAPYKINVNAVCPGYTITNIRDEWCKEQSRSSGITIDEVRARCYEEWSATVPLGRMGTTDDVADLVLFLVSSHSAYMTGQAINITGGLLMR